METYLLRLFCQYRDINAPSYPIASRTYEGFYSPIGILKSIDCKIVSHYRKNLIFTVVFLRLVNS
jgi:hypothetical protein